MELNAQDQAFSVCIIDEPTQQREHITLQLLQMGLPVMAFDGASAFYAQLAAQPPAVVVLEMDLLEGDGLSLCQQLRAQYPGLGMVMLTSRMAREDRLAGLAAGADAVLIKPIDNEELVLHVHRLLQRAIHEHGLMHLQAQRQQRNPTDPTWQLDPMTSLLHSPRQHSVRLSGNELQLLKCLFTRRAQVCTHNDLCEALGLPEAQWDKHRIEVIISRLRAKVARHTGLTLPLRSMRGQGYSLAHDTRSIQRSVL